MYPGERGVMALCWASSEGNLCEVKRLYANGIDINEADYDGRSPLHLACSNGHISLVKYLVCKGADVKALDRDGRTPLDEAIDNKNKKLIDYLKKEINKKK